MLQLQPTVTFIIPIRNNKDFLMEEINTVFEFSEIYPGFCELILAVDGEQDGIVKLAWLAIKLNKANHPHVRTKIIRYASEVNMNTLIETSLKSALGQKIVIATDNPKMNLSQTCNPDFLQREILTVQYLLNAKKLEELLSKTPVA